MLKTYGILVLPVHEWGAQSRQVRVVVAAPSQAKAVAALRRAGLGSLSVVHLRNYGGQTWNPIEVEVAESEPGAVFWREDQQPRTTDDYHRVLTDLDCTCGAIEVSGMAQHLVPCPLVPAPKTD